MATWSNKMSKVHYDMIAVIYRNLFMSRAFATLDDEGKTRVVVPVSDLLDHMCSALKADNPRFLDKLFKDACLK